MKTIKFREERKTTEATLSLYKRLRKQESKDVFHYIHGNEFLPIKEGEKLEFAPSPRGLRSIYKRLIDMSREEIEEVNYFDVLYIYGKPCIYVGCEGYDGRF